MDRMFKSHQPMDRMFSIIDEVARLRRPVTVSEIAERLAVPVPTVHRIVGQLLDRGILKRHLGTKWILPGPRLVALSSEVIGASIVADEPNRILMRLAQKIGENCHVGTVSDGEVLYVDSVRSGRSHGLQFEVGRRSPLYCTSIGKIWLAELSPSEFSRWLRGVTLARMTEKTITDPELLMSVVSDVRTHGWAISDEEFTKGVIGCAVPVRSGGSRRLLAALGISAPNARMDKRSIEALVPSLQQAADEIGMALDCTPDIPGEGGVNGS